MAYTVEQYVDAVWARTPRTVDAGSPAASDGTIVDNIAYAVWTRSVRTVETSGLTVQCIGIADLGGIGVPLVKLRVNTIGIAPAVAFGVPSAILGYNFTVSELVTGQPVLGMPHISQEDSMAVTTSSSGTVKRLTAAADAITGQLKISRIRWIGATTAAHVLEIRTGAAGANDIIFASVAAGANNKEESVFDPPLVVQGVTIQTLGSGTVYIYLG